MVGCRAYRQSSSGSSVCLRNATTTASSSADRTVDLGCLGPVGRSETEDRAFHLATRLRVDAVALRKPPQALLTMLYRSTDRLVVVALPCRTCPIAHPSNHSIRMRHQSPGRNT